MRRRVLWEVGRGRHFPVGWVKVQLESAVREFWRSIRGWRRERRIGTVDWAMEAAAPSASAYAGNC